MNKLFFAKWRRGLVGLAVLAIVFQVFGVHAVQAVQADFVPVTLCHQEGNGSYNQITVSTAGALNGHQGHAGDIIPAPEGGCPTGNQDSVVVTSSDVGVTKLVDGVSSISKNEGDAAAYTITAANSGPDTATSVAITDTLPAGVSFVSAVASQGAYDNNTGIWTVGDITSGGSATLTINVTVNSGTAGQGIINSAAVTNNNTSDSFPSNNVSGATINVNVKSGPPVVDETPCVSGPTHATGVVTNAQGTLNNGDPITDITRTDAANALGAADNKFISLGKNGSVVLSFNSYVIDVPGNDIAVYEITNGRPSYPEERAKVEVSQDGSTWMLVGTASGLDNGTGISSFDFSPTGLSWIKFIKISDTTDFTIHDATADGYDLDAVDASYGSCAILDPKKTGSYDSSTGTLTYSIDWKVLGTGSIPVTITDTLPVGTTYVPLSADNGGIYDNPSRTITWSLGVHAAGDTGTVTFKATLDAALVMDQWAKTVVSFAQGKQANLTDPVDVTRSDATQALGVAQSTGSLYDNPLPDYVGKFVSLGFTQANTGGQIVVAFDHPVYNGPGNDIQLYEITGGDNYPDEHAQISVSDDNTTWTDVGVQVVRDGGVDLGAIPQANYVRVTDTSDKAQFEATADGYDVDGVRALQLVPNICQVVNTAIASFDITVNDATVTVSVPASTTTTINKAFCQEVGFKISGQDWNDANNNAIKEVGETGLTGWDIYLDANDNGVKDVGETATTTDATGNYQFTGVQPGMYIVREVVQSGWTQTYPNAAHFGKHVVFVTNFDVTDKDFGNFQTQQVGGSGDGGGSGGGTPPPPPPGGGSSVVGGSNSGGGGTPPPPPGDVKGDSTTVSNVNTPAIGGGADPVTPAVLGATELPRTGSAPVTLLLALVLAAIGTTGLRKLRMSFLS